MPRAKDVKPGRWDDIIVLFDNGWYSIITGLYEGEESIGERWNGDQNNKGFPSTRGHAQWHVVPYFLIIPVLQGALEEINNNPYKNSDEDKSKIVNVLSKYLLM